MKQNQKSNLRHFNAQRTLISSLSDLSPVYTDMRFLHALTDAISDLNEMQDQIGSI